MKIPPQPVFIPLLNPNEPEALLVGLHVREGQAVSAGDPLCTLETTKSAAELAAEIGGYVVGLQFQQGQTVNAGATLCYLADSPGWTPPDAEQPAAQAARERDLPPGLRISQPALALARQQGLDLEQLPAGPLVTESMVRALLAKAGSPDFSPPLAEFDSTAMLLYGGGGHAKMLIELLRALGTYEIRGVVDDRLSRGETVLGVPVLGGEEVLSELHARGVRLALNAVGGMGNISVRIKVFRKLEEAGFVFPAVVHPRAFVEPTARLAAGVQVFPHAYVGIEARLGFGAIVSAGTILSHDCVLGDYVNLAPGAILAGAVHIGSGALVGMGVTVNLEVKIGAGARIGNGATIKADVPEQAVVRAGTIWPE